MGEIEVIAYWLFDLALVFALLGLCLAILRSEDTFTCIVYFIVFGLVMALAWVRLNAPDIALAEAALGSGMTGALLINAHSRWRKNLESFKNNENVVEQLPPLRAQPLTRHPIGQIVLIFGCGLFVVGMVLCVLSLFPVIYPLKEMVIKTIPNSGVANPVTAVLLNFRGYDTVLEMSVLLSALMGSLVLSRSEMPKSPQGNPILQSLVLVIVPVMILMSGYMLWAGADYPGGAFQGGALMAAAGVLLFVSGTVKPVSFFHPLWRMVLVSGVSAFVLIGVILIVRNGVFLMYSDLVKTEMLVIESLSLFSIALTLLILLFAGRSGDSGEDWS